MPRARNIKPGFFKNEDLAELSMAARLLFSGLWCMADREGRLEDRPKRIKIEVLPYDDCDIDRLLMDLHDACFIRRYVVDGSCFIQICKWRKHQRPHHKEVDSEIPSPDQQDNQACANHESTTDNLGECEDGESTVTTALNTDTGYRIPDTGYETSSEVSPPDDKSPDVGGEVFITIPLIDGSDHPIEEAEVEQYASLFPAVDVRQSLRSCKAWNLGNAKHRKTPGGIRRHITSWLSREQDRGGNRGSNNDQGNTEPNSQRNQSGAQGFWRHFGGEIAGHG